MLRLIGAISGWLDWFADMLSRLIVALFSILILWSVISRYGFHAPLSWSEEIARALLVWMTFLAGSVSVKRHEHVGFDLLAKKFDATSRVGGAVRIVSDAAIAIVAGILLVYGARLTGKAVHQTTSVLLFSQAWIYLAIPTGATIMLIHIVSITADRFSWGRSVVSENAAAAS
jgi:TRAP-type C4-dicarboxylate transport system permease small subunit